MSQLNVSLVLILHLWITKEMVRPHRISRASRRVHNSGASKGEIHPPLLLPSHTSLSLSLSHTHTHTHTHTYNVSLLLSPLDGMIWGFELGLCLPEWDTRHLHSGCTQYPDICPHWQSWLHTLPCRLFTFTIVVFLSLQGEMVEG